MDDAEARRCARASWPIRRVTLDQEDSPIVDRTPSERFAMVHQLTLDAWALSGRPWPTYERRDAPGRLIKRAP